MKNNLIKICIVIITIAGFASCKKDDAGLEPYDLQVSFNNSGAKYVTGDITVAPKDSVFFDFTISTSKKMKYVSIQKNGTDISKDTLTGSVRTTFSAIKKYAADSIAGTYTFRILAKDSAGVFLGDKNIVVTVTPDFIYYTAKTLYVPDSTAKTNPCYFSSSNGLTYSYTSAGSTNSASIDFGYFYDTTTTGTPKHTIYALNASTFVPYDLTTWTKNATIFKRVASGNLSSYTSGGEIKKQCIANLASGATSKITTVVANNVIFFKTAGGVYGAIFVAYINGNDASKSTYLNFEVKVVK